MGLPSNTNALQNGFAQGYQIGRSLRFRSSASAYLNRTPSVAGNRKTFTWSGWVKRGTLGAAQSIFSAYDGSGNNDNISFTSANKIELFLVSGGGAGTIYRLTTAVYRDPSAWYHIVVSLDTTNATAQNRARIWVNGVEVTAFDTNNTITQNSDTYYNSTNVHNIGRYVSGGYLDGYYAEVNFIDGQALTPSSFGVYDSNGIWQPIKYTGTYGTNGFYLPFSNTTSTTTLVADASGNGNNWTANNISLTAGTTYDSMLDSPTVSNASSNYAVLNPLKTLSQVTLSNANLGITFSATTTIYQQAFGTIGVSSGKWYFEFVTNSITGVGGGQFSVGVAKIDAIYNVNNFVSGNGWSYYGYNGYKYNTSGIAYGSTFGINDVIGVALDMDAGKIWFSKNNTWQASGDPVAGTNAAFTNLAGNTVVPFVLDDLSNDTKVGNINFGQRPFSYTPPSGYNALNTANLPQPLISNGANYMAATLYTGTGSNITITNSQSNGGNNAANRTFYPDFVWTKGRSAATNNIQIDSVRGGANYLISDSTSAEVNNAAAAIQSFSSTGYVMGTGGAVNTNGATYVAWQWKAGAGTTSTNTSGSITSTVSVSAQSGFSIATYTGTGANATVGHGLGVAPSMVIVKERNAVRGWPVYHSGLTSATYFVDLQTTQAQTSAATVWNSTAPTSSVFSIGTDTGTNQSTGTYVAYCFAAVKGYSAFGSYTGNGSTDGPMIYLGFKPRWVMWKNASAVHAWYIYDTSRQNYNPEGPYLSPTFSNAEASPGGAMDILSNGFKVRNTGGDMNASGNTIIYAAFAENPFNISRAF